MSMYRHLFLASILLTPLACKEKTEKKAANQASKVDSKKGQDATGEDKGSTDDGYYTGFDGTTDYSLLLPRFRTFSLEDPSIAKVENVKVTLSQSIIDELIAKAKQDNPDFEDSRFRQMLGREQTVYKITPLKAGKTAIKTSGGRGGSAGRDQTGWSKSTNINLIVTAYTAQQLEVGKKRYMTDGGGGNLRACKSCHETGAEGAPPHELGRIAEISDNQAMTWITTGKLESRTAKVQHTWEFTTDEEQNGIVAYLRSKQTHDVETLTKLMVEEMLANGGFSGPPPGGVPPQPTSGN